MALTATVTKKSVSNPQKDLYIITLNLSLKEAAVEVFNKDYTDKYRVGQVVSSIVVKFIASMQSDIDRYKAEQVIYNHAQLDTAVTNIQAGLTT